MTAVFTATTFELLAAIARTPTAAFYMERKADFKAHVEQPLQGLMRRSALHLPVMMRERMETQRNLFSRFIKNDFGRGGAWSNYWGAFYPRGSRRLEDVQLALWINARRLGISFYIGDYARLPRERFLRNVKRYRQILPDLLADLVNDPHVLLSREGGEREDAAGNLVPEHPIGWSEWLDDPRSADFWVRVALSPAQAIAATTAELEALAIHMHAAYFPLALLAIEDNPLPVIDAYLEG